MEISQGPARPKPLIDPLACKHRPGLLLAGFVSAVPCCLTNPVLCSVYPCKLSAFSQCEMGGFLEANAGACVLTPAVLPHCTAGAVSLLQMPLVIHRPMQRDRKTARIWLHSHDRRSICLLMH